MWNLENPQEHTVFSPARKNPHGAEITSLAWNRKYQHILATASSNGIVVVWDLKKKKTVTQFNTRHNVTAICWCPEGVSSDAFVIVECHHSKYVWLLKNRPRSWQSRLVMTLAQ